MIERRSLPCYHEAGHAGPHEAEDRIAEWEDAATYPSLVLRERALHGTAARKLRLWGSSKLTARDVLAAVLEWEGVASKLEEAGK
jgi:hypothetical protein